MEKEKITLKIPKKQKGLVFKIAVDGNNAGFFFNISKRRVELCLFYIAFRLYFMSEEKYNNILAASTLMTHNPTKSINFIRESDEVLQKKS